ncbi:hypothetical protein HYX70_03860 [Candidatus Saccharibacteria bacterium]|nr:hypothetical protein [Candidatus Saccharibacteria bacterium]
MAKKLALKRYRPLIVIFLVVLAFTGYKMFARASLEVAPAVLDFMGAFFIVVGAIKVYEIDSFAKTFAKYDEIAKHAKLYAYMYPFIEISIGLAMLFNFEVLVVTWVALCLMLIDSVGSYQGIKNPAVRTSATLGTVFRIPLTWVTLGEDVLIAGLAVITLFYYYR